MTVYNLTNIKDYYTLGYGTPEKRLGYYITNNGFIQDIHLHHLAEWGSRLHPYIQQGEVEWVIPRNMPFSALREKMAKIVMDDKSFSFILPCGMDTEFVNCENCHLIIDNR